MHVLLNSLCLLFLSFRIALQKFDQSAHIINLIVLALELIFNLINVILDIKRVETCLGDTFKLDFQKSHVGASIVSFYMGRNYVVSRQILEVNWVGRAERVLGMVVCTFCA